MEKFFVVVPIINSPTWRWAVQGPRLPYERYPSMVAKFRQKGHALMFAEQCNEAPAPEARTVVDDEGVVWGRKGEDWFVAAR